MIHPVCLKKLAEKGASNQTLRMTAAFLENRSMKIKMPGFFTTRKTMSGGAPQGTKCGNFLFCVTISDLTNARDDISEQPQPPLDTSAVLNTSLGLRSLADRIMEMEDPPSPPTSPLAGQTFDSRSIRHPHCFYDLSDNEDDSHILRRLHHEEPPRW